MVGLNLDNILIRTPLLSLDADDTALQGRIFLKPENLQPLGSYKIHGVNSFFKQANPEDLKRGVAALSAGNMGQSMAYFARQLGIPCTVYVPETAPAIKKNRIKLLNAEVKELPFDALWQFVTNPPSTLEGALLIHPIFTPSLLMGYEQIAYEVLQDLPDLDALVIPIGLGGLAIALSRVLKKINPKVDIFLCETENAPTFKKALTRGAPIKIIPKPSFVDAIGTPEALPEVYRQLAPLIKDSEVATLEHIEHALKMVLLNHKILCEGAAACSVAAAISIAKRSTHYKKIVCILTGGNMPLEHLTRIFSTS